MKNQYFGDVNDYRKYALLRALQKNGLGRLLVAWMLTPDDGSRDGGFRSYLKAEGKWGRYDPDLFAGLASMLHDCGKPNVTLIESSPLLPRTSYYSRLVPDTRHGRANWRKELLEAARGHDLVFLDPDNGLEVSSKPVGRKDSAKYVTWSEIEDLWNLGSSILIYQHYPRQRRELFTDRILSELNARTRASYADALCTPNVVFLLAAQRHDANRLREAVTLVARQWNGQISRWQTHYVRDVSFQT
jgi:hypothetical protein